VVLPSVNSAVATVNELLALPPRIFTTEAAFKPPSSLALSKPVAVAFFTVKFRTSKPEILVKLVSVADKVAFIVSDFEADAVAPPLIVWFIAASSFVNVTVSALVESVILFATEPLAVTVIQ